MTKRASVMFYVQHLLGTGHIRRIALIARAVAAQDIKVVVASGGFPVKNLDWGEATVWQLPPIRARDSGFSAIVDENGSEIDVVFKETRRDQLLACFNEAKPDVVVIETYPFGRRQLRFELMPLLEVMHSQESSPKLICSIRDVLQLKKEKRRQETLQIINHYFDAILMHGDASFIALGDSFPEANDMRCDVVYTGYVTDEAESQ
ncbi:MAG: glycosyl transferase, partial [Gammaproteobacteria bacterium]|nr:glycosyl transferase [Gammaproteobacteria bacterium]